MVRSRVAGVTVSVAVVIILASVSWNMLSFNDDTYYPEDVEAAWQSVVEITTRYTVENDNGRTLNLIIRGTGFIIEDEEIKRIITNAHVVSKYQGMTVNDIDLDSYHMLEDTLYIIYNFHLPNANRSEMQELSLIRYDLSVDLAILDFMEEVPDAPALVIADEESLRIGQDVFTIGNSLGNGLALSEGKIRSLSTRVRWISNYPMTAISTTISIYHGNSGGPLIISGGLVAGVIAAGRATSEEGISNISYAVPPDTIDSFLKAEA